jgi:uncharacterized protein (DUF488 family)
MQTPDFESGINELIRLAESTRVTIMCAEALPWRCHRSLIADALLVRGIEMDHMMTLKTRTKHSMTKFASIDGKQITYPQSLVREYIPPSSLREVH